MNIASIAGSRKEKLSQANKKLPCSKEQQRVLSKPNTIQNNA
jgi:hypothetical protein